MKLNSSNQVLLVYFRTLLKSSTFTQNREKVKHKISHINQMTLSAINHGLGKILDL